MAYSRGESGRVDREMKEVKLVMGTVDEQFAGNKMQDATEFLLRFLDEIKKDIGRLMRIPKWTSDEFSSELSFLT